MPFWMLIFLFTFFIGGCASFKPATGDKARSGTASRGSEKLASLDTFEGGDSECNDDDEDCDDSDVADADNVDKTPDDLGDVEVSEKRRAEEVQADALSRSTFPLVYNEFVEQWIKYFTGRGRPVFERWLSRSTRYIPVMKKVLKDEGLPEDLIYQAMIESGFNPKAASKAKAVGPWQFIKGTGNRYGMDVSYWIDERRDFMKSTHAAAQYLKELHQVFGSWYLAAAAYNAGEGKVLGAVRRDRSRNFWELSRKKKNFRAETRNYVPKIIAAALVAKNPEKYGFQKLDYEEPLVWDTVKIPGGVDLRAVADIAQIDHDYLQILNTELRRGITPPGNQEYEIRVPPTKKEIIQANIGDLKTKRFSHNFAIHEVKHGDTLASIARRYGSDSQSIMELNQIKKSNRLKPGMELSIPISEKSAKRRAKKEKGLARDRDSEMPSAKSTRTKPSGSVNQSSRSIASVSSGITHQVREGDTLWDIAKKHGVSVVALKKANGLKSRSRLKVGQVLVLPKG